MKLESNRFKYPFEFRQHFCAFNNPRRSNACMPFVYNMFIWYTIYDLNATRGSFAGWRAINASKAVTNQFGVSAVLWRDCAGSHWWFCLGGNDNRRTKAQWSIAYAAACLFFCGVFSEIGMYMYIKCKYICTSTLWFASVYYSVVHGAFVSRVIAYAVCGNVYTKPCGAANGRCLRSDNCVLYGRRVWWCNEQARE